MRLFAALLFICGVGAMPRFLRQAEGTHLLTNSLHNLPPLIPGEWMDGLVTTTEEPAPARAPSPPSHPRDTVREEPLQLTTEAPIDIITLPPVDRLIDLDGDGRLNLPEVQYAAFVHHGLAGTVMQRLFNEVDSDGDGYLTSREFNDIRPLVLARAENAALRYMQSVDSDHNGLLSLSEAQEYILREYGIGLRDVARVWALVEPNPEKEMDATEFSKLRRRIRGMTIRLARQAMKTADTNQDGHISLVEAQAVAFEQEGIGSGDVAEMCASVDDNGDGELNAPEFADFLRIVRARAVDTSKRALKVVDVDGSGTVTMDEAKRIAFEHYGFDETILGPFFDQADENEDGQLDPVEFAGFRSVIRSRAVKNALEEMLVVDLDGDGLVSLREAEEKTNKEDDMDSDETAALFRIADQNKSGKLDKVELADFVRLVRLSAIKFAADHFKEFDSNKDGSVTVDELSALIQSKYGVSTELTQKFFDKVDADGSHDLTPAEIVDFRHEIRKYVTRRDVNNNEESESAEEIEMQVSTSIVKIEKEQEQEQENMMEKPVNQTTVVPDVTPSLATTTTVTSTTSTDPDQLITTTQTPSTIAVDSIATVVLQKIVASTPITTTLSPAELVAARLRKMEEEGEEEEDSEDGMVTSTAIPSHFGSFERVEEVREFRIPEKEQKEQGQREKEQEQPIDPVVPVAMLPVTTTSTSPPETMSFISTHPSVPVVRAPKHRMSANQLRDEMEKELKAEKERQALSSRKELVAAQKAAANISPGETVEYVDGEEASTAKASTVDPDVELVDEEYEVEVEVPLIPGDTRKAHHTH